MVEISFGDRSDHHLYHFFCRDMNA